MIAFGYYLLKVLICSGLITGYYFLALRNRVFHHWNRFYLLASVVLSLMVPLIRLPFLQPDTEDPNSALLLLQAVDAADAYIIQLDQSTAAITREQWVVMGYALVSLLLFAGLVRSLHRLFLIIRRHPVRDVHQIRFVETTVKGTPFSFFRFIFWNRNIDLNSPAGQRILEHELVHVQQHHSIDKLVMQVILALFWCNPVFWLIRNELRDIHEFIADKKAVGHSGAEALAQMILQAAYPQQYNAFISPFFQTSIKRRLAMLTKMQHPKMNYAGRILALPLIALIVFAFTLKPLPGQQQNLPLQNEFVLVLDAGHGGTDAGAQWEGVTEKDLALQLVRKITALNQQPKIRIVLSRETDVQVSLPDRIALAEREHGSLFLSLHFGALPEGEDRKKASGFEVYIPKTDNAYFNQSTLFGSLLVQKINEVYPTKTTLLERQANVYVLNKNSSPAVLVECGYLTNADDRDFMTKTANQEALARKILQAVERYAYALENHEQPVAPAEADTTPQPYSPKTKMKDMAEALLVLNGVVKGKVKDHPEYQHELPKGGTVDVLDGAEGIRRYGQKGAGGILIIRTEPLREQNAKSSGTVPPEDLLVVIDGKVVGPYGSHKDQLPVPENIASINIIKEESMARKYGPKGKNGVMEVVTKKEHASAPLVLVEKPVVEQVQPLVIIDGKEWGTMKSNPEIEKIKPETIESMQVWKGEEAFKKYGEKGRNGVLEINLKKGTPAPKQ